MVQKNAVWPCAFIKTRTSRNQPPSLQSWDVPAVGSPGRRGNARAAVPTSALQAALSTGSSARTPRRPGAQDAHCAHTQRRTRLHPPAPARPWGAEGAPAHTADMPRAGHGTSAGREGTWLPGQTPRGKRPSGEMPWARVNCRGPVSAGVQDGASRCVPHRGVRRRSQGLGAGQLARQAD